MQKYGFDKMHCPCEDIRSEKEERDLAFPFVFWQKSPDMYENLEEAYCIGTIFPELNFPFMGKRK